ncbi:M14 family metallopeptidase [Maribacter thermophilus]|uniref:M14 family metallopeptidase n=1 Tax=Maribacter thermophilus TaxID=1197874 RepID=UPI00069A3B4F|nr:M14 metallopeptidase family protein [Maribacter thermophilus]
MIRIITLMAQCSLMKDYFSYGLLLIFILTSLNSRAQVETIPTPEDIIGFKVGADFHLATYEQSIAYFKALDAASDLVEMRETGKTSEGRTWYYVLISSKENLAKIDHYKGISQKLAHPEGIGREEARKLAEEGKVIVDLSGGLHASEVAGAQHIITLAHQIVSEADTKKFKPILEDVILVLWPSLNPDGQDIIANWYMSNVGTPYETARTPWLYQKYVGHDNNRDAYMLNMLESRVVGRTWREWEPNIIHVHHQSSPFPTRIWLPPFAEPIAPQTPPIVAREVNMIGMAMAQELETEGLPGAVHMGKGFDAWYPGYIDYLPAMQNIPSFWTETALYRYATPYFYTIQDFPSNRKDLRVESLYNSPWKGGWWRLSDAMKYMQTASIAVLDYSAKYKETLLFNKYQSASNTIEKYKKEPPFAYIIPQRQRDPVRSVELLKRLAFNGAKIYELDRPMEYAGVNYPKGTWVIPLDQEFGEMIRQVLDVQEYPDLRESPDGPLEQPYDAAGWTLPFQMEVKVVSGTVPLSEEFREALSLVQGTPIETSDDETEDLNKVDMAPGAGFDTDKVAAGIRPLPGSLKGGGGTLWLDPTENNIFRILGEAQEKGYGIVYDADQRKYGVKGMGKATAQRWINDYAVNGVMNSRSGSAKVTSKIAVYRPWTASMDMGWTRWLLDSFGFSYSSIRNADFKTGNLRDRFDVIVVASDRPSAIENGIQQGGAPAQYTKGLGDLEKRNLDAFIKEGGTLIALNRSADFAIEALHLPVENVVKRVDRAEFFTGGSIMQVQTSPTHPVMAGMLKNANIFVYDSPVFEVMDDFKGEILAKYQEKGSPLMSGYLVGEEYMNGRAAALDVHHGKGQVLLFGFQPQWRGQPMGTYRTLFNALLYANALPASIPEAGEGWLGQLTVNNKEPE